MPTLEGKGRAYNTSHSDNRAANAPLTAGLTLETQTGGRGVRVAMMRYGQPKKQHTWRNEKREVRLESAEPSKQNNTAAAGNLPGKR
jgi:predicted secreted protein